ncbi:MAG: uroporphyrinogen-III synthase [Gammaproteobacteria bacterium]|nr:uroporphyrinogen-III synthase [Gammaproteobacteria bacterium]
MARSLEGVSVLVTRPAPQGESLVAAIREAGGAALALPLLEIRELERDASADAVFDRLDGFDIAIFISANAVRVALGRWRARGGAWPAQLMCLAIGSATEQALAREGIAATSAAAAMNSEELLALDVLAKVDGRRIVIFKGAGGRDLLAASLRARGAHVSGCALYRRVAPATPTAELARQLARSGVDTVLISSGEGFTNLLGLLGRDLAGTMAGRITLVVPGERVAQLARTSGFMRLEVAANATDEAMLAALRGLAARKRAESEHT